MEIRDSGRGFKFVCNPNHHASWWTFEDEQSVRDLFWLPQEGDTILDVGCAFGSYALPALAAGARHIYAWNPLGSELELMAASLEANGWTDRVTMFQQALHIGSGFVNPDTAEYVDAPCTAPGYFPTRRLDEFLPQLEVGGECWLKIDVEGAEVDVLLGASDLIARHRPTILVEGHEFRRPGITEQVKSVLSDRGYDVIGEQPYHAVRHVLMRPRRP